MLRPAHGCSLARSSAQNAPRWLTFYFDPRVHCWCWARSVKSHSSIRLRLHLRPGAEQCVFLPRLEESLPGAYLPVSAPVPVVAPCHPAPRLEVSSPGARPSADLVAYCHWLPTLCCRLEVSSPVTQWPASFSGTAHDTVLHRSWYLPADLLPRKSAAQWICVQIFQSAFCQLRLLACSCLDSPLMMQLGLVSVPFNSSSGWTSELLHISPLEPCRSGLWMPERLGLPRGRVFFRRLWLALCTRRPPLSRRRILWESQDPLSHLLWLRRVHRRLRHHQCLPAATAAPWMPPWRRPLRSRLQWGRDPGHTWHIYAQAHQLLHLRRLLPTFCHHLVLPRASTSLCLGRVVPLSLLLPGGIHDHGAGGPRATQSTSEG